MRVLAFHAMIPGLALVLTAVAPIRAGFVERSDSLGLDWRGRSWGAVAADLDGDGDTDLLCGHHVEPPTLLVNDGHGAFTSSPFRDVLRAGGDRHGFLVADLDGDGLPDLVAAHGGDGGSGASTEVNELWRGTGGGRFVPIPDVGALADPAGRGRAFSAADVDGDGDLDLYLAKAPFAESPSSLWRNDGAFSFVDVAPALGLDEAAGTVGGLFADYDDDGDPDLLVGGEEFSRRTVLWRNDGDRFVDATATTLGSPPVAAGADWGDVDNDGDLDLAICEGQWAVHDVWTASDSVLTFYVNHVRGEDGTDSFRFETSGRAEASFRWFGSPAPERIFLGREGIHPDEPVVTLDDRYVGEPALEPGPSEGLFCWRESPGGAWRVVVTAPRGTWGNYTGRIVAPEGIRDVRASDLEQPPPVQRPPRVYRNDGGVFADVTAPLGLAPAVNSRAVAWVDFDDDGDLDLHLMNQGTAGTGNEPDVLWRNDGARFTALEGDGWVPGRPDHFTDGGVWSDYDRDGDADLFLQEGAGPLYFCEGARACFYRNDGPAGHWIAVTVSAAAGRTSVGARVTVHSGDLVVHRRVFANAWRGFQAPPTCRIGLGERTVADSVVVEWPHGPRRVVGPVRADREIRIEEAAR